MNTDNTNLTDNMSPTDMKEMTEMSLMDKNIKNTAVMAEFFELLCCHSSHAPESELSLRLEAHHGFVPKIGHRCGKNIKYLPD